MSGLAARIDPDRPETATEVGQALGDELVQVLARFGESRVVPLVQDIGRRYGREHALVVVRAYGELLRAHADGWANQS